MSPVLLSAVPALDQLQVRFVHVGGLITGVGATLFAGLVNVTSLVTELTLPQPSVVVSVTV